MSRVCRGCPQTNPREAREVSCMRDIQHRTSNIQHPMNATSRVGRAAGAYPDSTTNPWAHRPKPESRNAQAWLRPSEFGLGRLAAGGAVQMRPGGVGGTPGAALVRRGGTVGAGDWVRGASALEGGQGGHHPEADWGVRADAGAVGESGPGHEAGPGERQSAELHRAGGLANGTSPDVGGRESARAQTFEERRGNRGSRGRSPSRTPTLNPQPPLS
jgi:hypothetical protein